MQFYFGWLKFFWLDAHDVDLLVLLVDRLVLLDLDDLLLLEEIGTASFSLELPLTTRRLGLLRVQPSKYSSLSYYPEKSDQSYMKLSYMSRFRLSAAAFCVLIISTRFGSELERLKFDPLGSAGGGGGGGDFCEVLCELPELKDWFRLLLLAAGVWCAT